jgi:hypothetical protein
MLITFSPNSTMYRTASRITRSMVLRSSGVSRSLVVLFDLGLLYAMVQKSSFVPGRRLKLKSDSLTGCSQRPNRRNEGVIQPYIIKKGNLLLPTEFASPCPPLLG